MKPWELSIIANDEKFLLREWAKLRASDFYFASILGQDDLTTVYITPRLFFIEHGHMYKDSMPISHLLPDMLRERFPSVFYAREQEARVYSAMFAAGFTHASSFQDFAREAHADYPVMSSQC